MGWYEFVKDHRIDYLPGSGRKNIDIKCPFCAIQDFSSHSKTHHMGLHLESAQWACWRDSRHRSRGSSNPERLIAKLLKCSIEEAETKALSYFGNKKLAFREIETTKKIKSAKVPVEFIKFGTEPMFEKKFIAYLRERHLHPELVIDRYDIRWCMTGKNANRVIIPIIYNDQWYSWVARAISSDSVPRYLAALKDICDARPNDLLFDLDNLTGGRILLVTEGVFDAMAVTSALQSGVDATCLFGKVLSLRQLTMLTRLSPLYDSIVFALDQDAHKDSVSMIAQVDWYLNNAKMIRLSQKDFGSMNKEEIKKELDKCLSY